VERVYEPRALCWRGRTPLSLRRDQSEHRVLRVERLHGSMPVGRFKGPAGDLAAPCLDPLSRIDRTDIDIVSYKGGEKKLSVPRARTADEAKLAGLVANGAPGRARYVFNGALNRSPASVRRRHQGSPRARAK
jgi:hypothetical protein